MRNTDKPASPRHGEPERRRGKGCARPRGRSDGAADSRRGRLAEGQGGGGGEGDEVC